MLANRWKIRLRLVPTLRHRVAARRRIRERRPPRCDDPNGYRRAADAAVREKYARTVLMAEVKKIVNKAAEAPERELHGSVEQSESAKRFSEEVNAFLRTNYGSGDGRDCTAADFMALANGLEPSRVVASIVGRATRTSKGSPSASAAVGCGRTRWMDAALP